MQLHLGADIYIFSMYIYISKDGPPSIASDRSLMTHTFTSHNTLAFKDKLVLHQSRCLMLYVPLKRQTYLRHGFIILGEK